MCDRPALESGPGHSFPPNQKSGRLQCHLAMTIASDTVTLPGATESVPGVRILDLDFWNAPGTHPKLFPFLSNSPISPISPRPLPPCLHTHYSLIYSMLEEAFMCLDAQHVAFRSSARSLPRVCRVKGARVTILTWENKSLSRVYHRMCTRPGTRGMPTSS